MFIQREMDGVELCNISTLQLYHDIDAGTGMDADGGTRTQRSYRAFFLAYI